MDLERELGTLLEGGLPLILVVGMRQSFALRIHLLPVVAALEGVVDGTLS